MTQKTKVNKSQVNTAIRMLRVCIHDQPKTMSDVMANMTMQLVSDAVIRYGNLDTALTKISEAINIVTELFNETP